MKTLRMIALIVATQIGIAQIAFAAPTLQEATKTWVEAAKESCFTNYSQWSTSIQTGIAGLKQQAQSVDFKALIPSKEEALKMVQENPKTTAALVLTSLAALYVGYKVVKTLKAMFGAVSYKK